MPQTNLTTDDIRILIDCCQQRLKENSKQLKIAERLDQPTRIVWRQQQVSCYSNLIAKLQERIQEDDPEQHNN